MKPLFILVAGLLVFTTFAHAQSNQRRQATIRGGGSSDTGKCTIEVVVDGAAEVSIQGAYATLRTRSGQTAQWRRFECTSAMPSYPANFRFAGVDGRGRQSLIRDPQNGGVTVVQIEDPDNGSEGYTFDLTWSGDQGYRQQDQGYRQQQNQSQSGNQQPGGYRDYSDDRYRQDYRDTDYFRRYGHGYAVDDAIQTCRLEVNRLATRRFRSADYHIRRMDIDDNPGRNDWVLGSLDVHRGPREGRYNFSCSVDFNSGKIRSVEIDQQRMR